MFTTYSSCCLFTPRTREGPRWTSEITYLVDSPHPPAPEDLGFTAREGQRVCLREVWVQIKVAIRIKQKAFSSFVPKLVPGLLVLRNT